MSHGDDGGPAFLLDENISYKIADALGSIDLPVEHVTRVLPQGTGDVDVFNHLRGSGWLLVTQDKKIRRRKHERAAMINSGVGVFVFSGRANKTVTEMTRLLLGCFQAMSDYVAANDPPFVVSISDKGKLQQLEP